MKKDRKGLYLAIFLIAVMVSSVAGFYFGSSEGEEVYKGNKFILVNNQWQHQKTKELFSYLPGSVESIALPEEAKMALRNAKAVAITYDSNATNPEDFALSEFYLSQTLYSQGIYPVSGRTGENQFNITVMGCQNATAGFPVIYLSEDLKEEINFSNGCIVAGGNPEAISDRIRYFLIGVIK